LARCIVRGNFCCNLVSGLINLLAWGHTQVPLWWVKQSKLSGGRAAYSLRISKNRVPGFFCGRRSCGVHRTASATAILLRSSTMLGNVGWKLIFKFILPRVPWYMVSGRGT
jgi:hypothetical protein